MCIRDRAYIAGGIFMILVYCRNKTLSPKGYGLRFNGRLAAKCLRIGLPVAMERVSACLLYTSFMENSQPVRRMQRALADLTAYASRLGVKITLEDFDGFTQPFARMNQLLWFMRNVPGLCYTLDMGNFAFSDEDAVAAARLLKEYIVHVHCKDRALNPSVCGTFCKGLGQTPAGSGYLPLKELIGMLKEWGYDGYLAIEHFDVPDQAACIEPVSYTHLDVYKRQGIQP